jgi:hypothetical protein
MLPCGCILTARWRQCNRLVAYGPTPTVVTTRKIAGTSACRRKPYAHPHLAYHATSNYLIDFDVEKFCNAGVCHSKPHGSEVTHAAGGVLNLMARAARRPGDASGRPQCATPEHGRHSQISLAARASRNPKADGARRCGVTAIDVSGASQSAAHRASHEAALAS